MKKSRTVCCFVFAWILFSCNKYTETLDVSQQVRIDYNGNLTADMPKGRWYSDHFNGREWALFNLLDTADVSGTTMTDSTAGFSFVPNPFSSDAIFAFTFYGEFSGMVTCKYVIVDNHMKIKDRGAVKVQAHVNSSFEPHYSYTDYIHLKTTIQPGQYRLYTTLSCQWYSNFYTHWQNIEKAP